MLVIHVLVDMPIALIMLIMSIVCRVKTTYLSHAFVNDTKRLLFLSW